MRKMFSWNPADYAANSASQLSWARELIARQHLRGDETILDVGCGDGKVTAELAQSVPRGCVIGIDASPEMIEFARDSFRSLEFHVMDARRIKINRSFDMVFSNATLHWVDDHPSFLRGASECLRRGGRLVVSCGGKGNAQDVFVALRSRMRRPKWREYFRRMQTPYFFHSPAEYTEWLPEFGFNARRVELAGKEMVLQNVAAFSGWLRTTWLPYTQRLPEHLRGEFIGNVVESYVARHPVDAEGRVRVRMVRLEIDAVKI